MEKILLKNIDNPNAAGIEEYMKSGGYSSLAKALERQPKDVIDEVK